MDPIDILGSLLGHKSGRSGRGADILKDILQGGARSQPRSQPRSQTAPSSRDSHRSDTRSRELRPGDIEREARELEDLLNVANERRSRRGGGRPAPQPQRPPRQEPDLRRDTGFGQQGTRLDTPKFDDSDERAVALVRAMVNAAKSDGQISQSEQQSILEHVGDTSHDTIQFLRDELSKPLDVREYAWSVPLGMEQQVYTMSLIAIDLDTRREAKYLLELAHGLRISDSVREQIHQRLGAPSI